MRCELDLQLRLPLLLWPALVSTIYVRRLEMQRTAFLALAVAAVAVPAAAAASVAAAAAAASVATAAEAA
jgi:hypothetical protein